MNARMTIPGRFPSLNEVIGAARSNKFAAARQKKAFTMLVATNAMVQRVPHFTGPVEITCVWYEKNERRDVDNVASGVKFILDGLVTGGVLDGDGRKYVQKISHLFPLPDPKKPRVEVHIVSVPAEHFNLPCKAVSA